MRNDKLKVGFVGAGWMGATQMKRLCERDDVTIVALADPNEAGAKAVLAELGLPEDVYVKDYEAIVQNPDIAAVWLVSPNCYHGPQAIAALEAGKHVFCEKPAATTYADFVREIDLERAHPHLYTFVDYILYFDAMEQRLRDMVAADEFGQITQIQVNYRHPVNIAGAKAWKLKQSVMGDAIGMGINHALSVMVMLMAPQARPVGVFATSLASTTRGFEAPPIWNILVRFSNGAAGFCHGNIDNGAGYDALHTLHGTAGGFVFDAQQPRPQKVRYWSAATENQWFWPLDPSQAPLGRAQPWPADTTTPDSGNVVEHQTGVCVAHFLESIRTGTPSPLSFANSAVIGEIGWAAQISAATGTEVALPLDPATAKRHFGS